MSRDALGLIETLGLIGAIEAADAAAKAADVHLPKAEVTQAALVTVHIEGELGAVQAAVEAGVAACQRIGRLWSYVIIPRPDPGLDVILDAPTNLYLPQGPFCAIVPSPKASGKPPASGGSSKREGNSVPRTRRPFTGGGDYASMTVQALRRLGRRRGDLPLAGRDIARAGKETLVRLLTEADAKR
jgi:hypothetical protein